MRKTRKISAEEKLYVASQWQLMWRKFIKHKLAILGGTIVLILYITVIFGEFFSPYGIYERHMEYTYYPPQKIHFFDEEKNFHLRPFVYGINTKFDLATFTTIYTENKSEKNPIYFLVHGDEYKLWNIFKTDVHFFGVKEGVLFLFGTDTLGRDLFSRNLSAGRISLSIGLVGVAFSFILGSILGGISGYYGGTPDIVIQRVIELLISLPTIPLWMALSVALPQDWPVIKTYFGITIVLSIMSWAGLARIVRGSILGVRGEDFIMAAKIAGASESRIIVRHLFPSIFSYLIVHLTMSVPWMILGETALSFLGLGIRPPAVSWGALLKDAQNVRTIALYPWLLIPGVFVIITVLAFNFAGEGLRDAADPYK
ncbi:hypothetical protein ES703_123526 [subsurface metagenome]